VSAPLLTARQVADLLGFKSPETILRWHRKGNLPSIPMPSGAIRFRESDLDAWLEERAMPRQRASPTPQDAAHGSSYRHMPESVTYPEGKED